MCQKIARLFGYHPTIRNNRGYQPVSYDAIQGDILADQEGVENAELLTIEQAQKQIQMVTKPEARSQSVSFQDEVELIVNKPIVIKSGNPKPVTTNSVGLVSAGDDFIHSGTSVDQDDGGEKIDLALLSKLNSKNFKDTD